MTDKYLLDSEYGQVIHNDVDLEHMPADLELLIRSVKAYWDQVVFKTYQDNLMTSRIKSTLFAEKIWQLGWIDQYPEVAPRLAALKYARGEYDFARDCMEYWCEHIHLTADMNALTQDFCFYMDQLRGDYEKVLDWCRRRAELDRLRNDVPVGMILLRHYLRIQCFLNERREDEDARKFWERMYQSYRINRIWAHQLIEHKWQRAGHVILLVSDEPDQPNEWEKNINRTRAKKGSLIALSHVLDKNWTFDTPEMIAEWQAMWDASCAEIKKEEQSFGSDWFEREREEALEVARQQKESGAIRREGRNLYIEGLVHYAVDDVEGATDLMRKAMDKKSYEAKGWLKRHDIDFTDTNPVKPYKELMDVEILTNQLRDNSNIDGLQRLANILERGGDLFDPMPELADKVLGIVESLRREVEYIDYVFAHRRKVICDSMEQMNREAKKNPEMADDLHWYRLLIYINLAQREYREALDYTLDFITIDQKDKEDVLKLVSAAKDNDLVALYNLCIRYGKDIRRKDNPYLSAVVYHLGTHLCQIYRRLYFATKEIKERNQLLKIWIEIVLLMEEGDLEPIKIGLYLGNPYCESLLVDNQLVQRLDVAEVQRAVHLYHARECGQDVGDVLQGVTENMQYKRSEKDFLEINSQWESRRYEAQTWMANVDSVLKEADLLKGYM